MLKSKIKKFQSKLDEFNIDKLTVCLVSIFLFFCLLILCRGISNENIAVIVVFGILFGFGLGCLLVSVVWLSKSRKELIKAEQALEVAKKEAEASIEKSKGEAEALKIMQDAWDALSGEVKDAMLKQMAIEKWDGHLPETMVGDEFIKELMGFISSKTE